MTTTTKLAFSSRVFILCLGLLQGVAAYLISHYDSVISPDGFIFCWSLAIAIPLFVMLLVGSLRARLFWLLSGAYLVLVAGMSWYVGYQCSDGNAFMCSGNIFPSYILPQAVAWFIALFFAQVWLREGRREFSYSALYDASWHNTITLALAGVFTGLAWAILGLCAALFNAIGVHYFAELFSSAGFAWPASGVLVAVGIVLFREMHGVVEVIKRILRILVRWLLVGVAVLVLMFLATLVATGLQPLWNTRSASLLLLWIIAVSLFCLCAVYQDGGDDMPYPKLLGWLIKAAMLVLPIYAVIAGYALSLRVLQYGWTLERLLALVVLLVLSGFVLAYDYALVRYRRHWVAFFIKTNRAMAMVVMVICGLLATPLLDMHRISAHSLIAHYAPARIKEPQYLDYLRFELGRAGYQALQALRERNDVKQDTQALAAINAVIAKQSRWQDVRKQKHTDVASLRRQILVFPPAAPVPDGVFAAILTHEGEYHFCSYLNNQCYLLVTDLTGDPQPEYLLLSGDSNAIGDIYSLDDKGQYSRKTRMVQSSYFSRGKLAELLRAGDYAPVTSKWKQLRIGDVRLHVTDE